MDLRPGRLWRAARRLPVRLASPGYGAWIARHERAAPTADLADGPSITVIAEAPEQAAESLRAQSYTRWQLETGGDYTAFLDAGDTLAPHALAWVAAAIDESRPEAVYTDEDVIEDGRVLPVFKPDWSPALLAQPAYPGGLLVVATPALEGCQPATENAAGVRAALERLAAFRAKVAHVPRVLYHRAQPNTRLIALPDECGGQALVGIAPRRTEARRSACGCREQRSTAGRAAPHGKPGGPLADVANNAPSGTEHAQFARQPGRAAPHLASIIICSRQPRLLRACLDGIEACASYSRRETVAVQHGFDAQIGDRRVPWTGEFDFAAMNNLAAQAASGEVLVFLNDDVTPLAPEWLGALVAQAMRPEVGIAGALLEYPDGAIQHAGVVVGIAGVAAHPLRGQTNSPLWRWARCTREVSAVTGACLAIRKRVFDELGGFDTVFPRNYNDVDLCLRARRAGYEVILEAAALLRHDEARTRSGKTTAAERELFVERWREVIHARDPYYSPNLSYRRELPLLAWE